MWRKLNKYKKLRFFKVGAARRAGNRDNKTDLPLFPKKYDFSRSRLPAGQQGQNWPSFIFKKSWFARLSNPRRSGKGGAWICSMSSTSTQSFRQPSANRSHREFSCAGILLRALWLSAWNLAWLGWLPRCNSFHLECQSSSFQKLEWVSEWTLVFFTSSSGCLTIKSSSMPSIVSQPTHR